MCLPSQGKYALVTESGAGTPVSGDFRRFLEASQPDLVVLRNRLNGALCLFDVPAQLPPMHILSGARFDRATIATVCSMDKTISQKSPEQVAMEREEQVRAYRNREFRGAVKEDLPGFVRKFRDEWDGR